jgi:hypothetical protein
MKKETKQLLNKAQQAKLDYRFGKISEEEAIEEVKPYKEVFDKEQVKIAKKFGKRPAPLNIKSFIR